MSNRVRGRVWECCCSFRIERDCSTDTAQGLGESPAGNALGHLSGKVLECPGGETDAVFCSTLVVVAHCVLTIGLEGEDKDES